jgi:hypothetical protein
MDFRISDTFTASLARLTGEEQKTAKMTAFDLQMNPANPGLSYHKLEHARDARFWSVRANRDLRLIVHRTEESLLLCYVDHHDKAYQWAERRKLETHPRTGAAQMVEIRETVQELIIPRQVEAAPAEVVRKPLFDRVKDEDLLDYGVPLEWLADVKVVDEDGLFLLAEHLPAEAAEALLELATGGRPKPKTPIIPVASPFDHPDAQRRFRVMANADELAMALDAPWDKWTVFLHPAQRQMVERDYSGPARVSGSAGTGKTIVALHRAVHLARTRPEARVLLTTFSEILANALRGQLRRLISKEPRLAERLEVHSMNALAERLYESTFGPARVPAESWLRENLEALSGQVPGHRFTLPFLLSEWADVVDAWQLTTWEDYRDVKRLGRKTRLPEAQRAVLWKIFEGLEKRLKAEGLITQAGMFHALAKHVEGRKHLPYDHAVVDEAQDVSIPQLRFLAALGARNPNALFFTGDLGQRIFQQPFSWKAMGVEIRGRSKTLTINYRTSHQIRMQADRLLGPEVTDVDGNVEERTGTISVFNGPPPSIQPQASPEAEVTTVGAWLKARLVEGLQPHEMGIFVRSAEQVERAQEAAQAARIPAKVLDDLVETTTGFLSIGTMHLAKGLEFRAVVVMACEDEVVPLMERIESAGDESELEEIYSTERHLLYVACTRARDFLLITCGGPASEFLDDLGR